MPRTRRPLALTLVFLAGCPSTETPGVPEDATATDTGALDALPDAADEAADDDERDASIVSDADLGDVPDVNPFDPDASYPRFCDLPGSVLFTDQGKVVLPGIGTKAVDFMRLPLGFCVHYFGNLAELAQSRQSGGNVRQLRFAPGGELFVASPIQGTTGGGIGGLATIMVVPDDDHDGLADAATVFADDLPATQGLLFANDGFYYQNGTQILRVPYRSGDRTPAGPPQLVGDTRVYYSSALHWPKALDQSDDGTIFVANGSDQDEGSSPTGLGAYCAGPRRFVGGILKLDGSPNGVPISLGYRNPIAVRCQRGHNVCFTAELAKDYSAEEGGREKLVPIRNGDDWGFPCCATRGLSYKEVLPPADCSKTTPEDVGFFIGDTPFGFDFERGKWAAPYANGVFIALHGAAGSWVGARVVAVRTDPTTGAPLMGTSAGNGMSAGAMTDFIIGWDDGTHAHGRPGSIEFAEDGRMFLGDDATGNIYWIAPIDLPR